MLLITTLATSVVAWRQYNELVELRAAALEPAKMAPAPAPVVAAKSIAQPSEDIAKSSENDAPRPEAPEREGAGLRQRLERGPNNFAAMMERPEVQRLLALQRKAELDGRYSALFRQLNLRPEQLDAFKNLLVDKSNALTDVRAAAREQGVNPRNDPEAYRKLVSDAQAQIDESIRAQLGEAGFAQYKSFEETQPQRAVVSQLEQRLSYSSTPLTPAQSAQLVQLLASSSPAPATPQAAIRGLLGGQENGRSRVAVTDTTITQAMGVLAAPQIDALKQIQQEQQVQAQLNAAMRAQMQNTQRDSRAGGAAPAATPPPGGG